MLITPYNTMIFMKVILLVGQTSSVNLLKRKEKREEKKIITEISR